MLCNSRMFWKFRTFGTNWESWKSSVHIIRRNLLRNCTIWVLLLTGCELVKTCPGHHRVHHHDRFSCKFKPAFSSRKFTFIKQRLFLLNLIFWRSQLMIRTFFDWLKDHSLLPFRAVLYWRLLRRGYNFKIDAFVALIKRTGLIRVRFSLSRCFFRRQNF